MYCQGGSKKSSFLILQETQKIDKIWWNGKKAIVKEKLIKFQSFNQQRNSAVTLYSCSLTEELCV